MFKRRERIRSTRIRSKVTVLLASLVALWAFAAWVTTREGLDLLTVNQIDQQIGRPANSLVSELQQERRLSLIYLGHPSRQNRSALLTQRSRTDQANSKFTRQGHAALDSIGRADIQRQLRAMFDLMGGLNTVRFAVDNGGGQQRGQAADAYNRITDGAFALYAYNAEIGDRNLAREGRALIAMEHAKEFLAREDSLLEGALAFGRFSTAEHLQFTELVGAQRLLQSQAAADLPDADQPRYAQLVNSPSYRSFRALEDGITRSQGRAPVTSGQWTQAVRPVIAGLEQVVLAGGDDVVKSAKPVAIGVIARLALAGGLGLLAVIASIVVSITTVRSLLQQLQRLRRAAWELASERLPSVVERLGHGEKVVVEEEAPPLSFGEDEVGQVGRAFNSVQETAIRTAVEQAELRRDFREILLSLARRSQTMLHRQLNLLDEMERREDDATDLEDLFRVDHLATRMRRNAENLIVLSGATPARGWRRPVPMIDVVRSAVAEVEDYTRVEVATLDEEIALSGHAVGDVVHLLAELIENAVSFSPPDTQAHVSGRRAARGYAIEIEDRGLGMTDQLLETINKRVSESTEFNLSGSTHLGLYVVGRLAERYDVRVSLKHSSYGGTTAVVLIPQSLIEDVPEDGDTLDRFPPPVPAVTSGPAGPLTMVRDAPAKVAETERTDGRPPALPQRRRARPETENGTTPGGLPVRKPQASIAPALRTDEPPAAEKDDGEGPGRSPAEIRKSIGGLQASTRRARSEAAQAKKAEAEDG